LYNFKKRIYSSSSPKAAKTGHQTRPAKTFVPTAVIWVSILILILPGKRILKRKESAEAARRELEWESGQTCKSGAQDLRGEADEIFGGPSTDEGGEDEDDDLEEAPRNARKKFRGLLCMTIDMNRADFHQLPHQQKMMMAASPRTTTSLILPSIRNLMLS